MDLLNAIQEKNFISGKWVNYNDQIKVTNPSDDTTLGSVPKLNQKDIHKAIDATAQSFLCSSKTSISHRVQILQNWHNLILENIDQLARIISLEQGKIVADALGEVKYGASFIDWYAKLLPSLEGSIKSGSTKNSKIIVEYEPIGPCAAITPWNFPVAMITRKLAPAIAAGCSVLVKPSELTPFSALALAKLAEKAGLVNGEINVITGKSSTVGEAICASSKIRKLSFTGSTEVGQILYQQSAGTLKKLSMELGGNAPFIICSDVDIQKTVDDLITAKIRSNGQSCISPNRIFVHKNVYEQFIEILKNKFLKLKTGNAFDSDSNIGPLINKDAIEKIARLFDDAKQRGAKLYGGSISNNFLSPAVLTNLTVDADIFNTEIFGPVIACYKFSSEEEVIKLSNDTKYGLQAYVYSNDLNKAQKLATELDFGMVSINSPLPSNSAAPFGGRKYSGFGSEGGIQGIYEYLNIKYINLNFTYQ